jgi:hypothetical protein
MRNPRRQRTAWALAGFALTLIAQFGLDGCSTDTPGGAGPSGSSSGMGTSSGSGAPPIDPSMVPEASAPGRCVVPAAGGPEDSSKPTEIVGTGTAASCTGEAFVQAVAKGGVITFNCGDAPITIVVPRTAQVFNNKGPKIVIDGGGKVTLSGEGKRRILYQNTCDESLVYTTPHCQNQDHPQLTLQNLSFVDGNAKGETKEGGGGGAVFVRGGRLKIINSKFFRNVCDDVGPDVGGGAVRVLSQFDNQPVYIVGSTFGGKPELGNVCSNGSGLSSIGVSSTVINTVFSHNRAIGRGANPAKSGTPGGGSGGAIYNDGNTFRLSLCGVVMEDNHANEGGGGIFFVSNDRSGTLAIQDSMLRRNKSDGFETNGLPGIFVLAKEAPSVVNSTVE